MNNFAKKHKKKKHKKCKNCSSWVSHGLTSCPSCNHAFDFSNGLGNVSDSISDSSDSGSSDSCGSDGGMSAAAWVDANCKLGSARMNEKQAKDWVAKNCKFAMELPPVGPPPAAVPAQQPQDPMAKMEDMYYKSFHSFKVLDQKDSSDVQSIEEDRFSPNTGHFTETTGAYNDHAVDLVIGAKIYWPDALAANPSYAEIGGLNENLLMGFNEDQPSVVTDVNHMWEESVSNFTVISATRTGDWYDVTVKCELSGNSPYERPEPDYDPMDRDY